MSATNHKAIARAVWPEYVWEKSEFLGAALSHREGHVHLYFNLLETDSKGNPTQQANASAFDVLVWMRSINIPNSLMLKNNDYIAAILTGANPCEAIYKAACEALELK